MIRPLDLQTMFMNLDKTGKELAQSRENVIHQQAAQAQKLQKIHDQQEHAVTQTEGTTEAAGEEANKIKADDQEQEKKGRRQASSGQKKQKNEEPSDDDKNEWKDPELGRHVDLSG